jgi:hypothetical protein
MSNRFKGYLIGLVGLVIGSILFYVLFPPIMP